MAPRDLLQDAREAAARMRRESRRACTEAQAQRHRCELIRTQNDQLRARLQDRYPGWFTAMSRDES
jgi:hypothetical protein